MAMLFWYLLTLVYTLLHRSVRWTSRVLQGTHGLGNWLPCMFGIALVPVSPSPPPGAPGRSDQRNLNIISYYLLV